MVDVVEEAADIRLYHPGRAVPEAFPKFRDRLLGAPVGAVAEATGEKVFFVDGTQDARRTVSLAVQT